MTLEPFRMALACGKSIKTAVTIFMADGVERNNRQIAEEMDLLVTSVASVTSAMRKEGLLEARMETRADGFTVNHYRKAGDTK